MIPFLYLGLLLGSNKLIASAHGEVADPQGDSHA
jgi:hypothetical protein